MTFVDWQYQAVCGPVDQEYDPWFSDKPDERKLAKAICESCPVKIHCLTSALVNGYEFGIFGGMDEEERIPLREKYLGNPELEVLYLLPNIIDEVPQVKTASVEARYRRRIERAEICYNELLNLHPDEQPDHYRVWIEALRAVFKNPQGSGDELGRAIGRSAAVFNSRIRECFDHFGLGNLMVV